MGNQRRTPTHTQAHLPEEGQTRESKEMAAARISLLLLCHCIVGVAASGDDSPNHSCVKYCRPDDPSCFPNATAWEALGAQLSGGQSALFKVPHFDDPKMLNEAYKR